MTFEKILALGHLACVVALMFASYDGLQAYFVPVLGTLVGGLLAAALVFGVDGGLAASLRDWRLTGSWGMLLLTIIFLVISWSITLPFWYRVLRGEAVLVTAFEDQRNDAVRDVVKARDTLSSVVSQAHALSARSSDLAKAEFGKGFTCENIGNGEGPRRRFRGADAARFTEVERSVIEIRDRLNGAVTSLERLPSIAHTDPAAVLRLTNDAVAVAHAATQDQALRSISQSLHERSRTDGDVRSEPGSKETFRCPDAQIAEGATRMADSIDGLPAMNTRVAVPDVRDARTAFVELPSRIIRTVKGEKNGLDPQDNIALAFGALAELLVLASALFTYRRRPGRWLRQVEATEEFSGSGALKFFAALAKRPDPEIAFIVKAIERYRLRFGRINLIVISHGCNDPLVARLEWSMPILTALNMARRDRWLPERFLDLVAYFRWPETRGCYRREAYHFQMGTLDELQLAEVIAKMKEASEHKPSPPIAPDLADIDDEGEQPGHAERTAESMEPEPGPAHVSVAAEMHPASDRSPAPKPAAGVEVPSAAQTAAADAVSALSHLGVRRSQAEAAVSAAQAIAGPAADVGTLIRAALQQLGQERRLLPPPSAPPPRS
jgi:hypothetical protein